jgi:hypothetical protein
MSWTRKRVTILAAVIFVAHIIGIFALHTPRPMVSLQDDFRTPRLTPTPIETNASSRLEGLNDPLVFAGAHEHGFSAAAWMTKPHQDYVLTNSKSPPRFLAFARAPMKFPPRETQIAVPGRTALPFVEISLLRNTQKSILRIEGGLENRALLKTPEIPTQSASDVLSNTVVQVAVKPDGFPFSARVVTGSGSRVADLRALQIANQLRFAPLSTAIVRNANDLQWGECVFQWFTTEPAAPNATNAAPSGPKVTAK